MGFTFEHLAIHDVIYIVPTQFADERGVFMERYKQPDFAAAGIDRQFVQINHSRSARNVLRGLHFQSAPMDQAKLVYVVNGEVFDVAVDIGAGSSSYGKWVGRRLSAANGAMMYIPEGFAHGFCVISQAADVCYACTQIYSPQHDRGIRWDDPAIKITWPIDSPVVSEKDAQWPLLDKR